MKTPVKPDESPPQARAAVAERIALEASALARLANANQFKLLSYLIDMVVLEAWREASDTEPDSEPGAAPMPAAAEPC